MAMTAPRRVRVVQVLDAMHIGGAENAVVHLARGLARDRFDVAVCCTRERGLLAEQLASEGIEVVVAAPPGRSNRYLTPLALWRTLRQLRADVVHTHGTPSLLHAGPLRALGVLPPWVHTYHYGNYPLPSARQMRGERILSRLADQLVAVAEPQRDSLVRCHGLAPERLLTIHNGVSVNPFVDRPEVRARLRADLGIAADESLVGCAAVLTAQKGLDDLVDAFAAVATAHPRARLLVAGRGPLEGQLKAHAERAGLGRRAIFPGWRQDNQELMTALDVFVMSSWWEAMPLALLEAMAARRAIVVTDVGDNRRVVEDGRCAQVVPARNPAALAAAIETALRDSAAAAAMAAAAQRRFLDRFTTDRMVCDYMAVYDRVARR
jgi:glycosyltransferase involved in cell wall biosynthesis